MPQGPTDLLAVLAVAAFVAGVLAERRDREFGRRVTAAAWVLFAGFWLVLVPHFAFVQKSIVEGILSAVAVPACLYTAYLVRSGRDSLFVLSRAVALMGVFYLPFEVLVVLERALVEFVTRQIEVTIYALGYHPEVVTGAAPYPPFRNTFVFQNGEGRYATTIVLACTGLGSMAIFAGLIGAVRAPPRRKLRALAVSIPVIWVLNIVRNVFIALAHGRQWFQGLADPVLVVFGATDPALASFYLADRIISQSLSVVALVAIAWLVARELPELLVVAEDLLYLVTGTEYDLRDALARQPVRADGDGRSGR